MHTLARIHCALALLLLLAVGSSVSKWVIGPFCCNWYGEQMPLNMLHRYYEQEIDDDCKQHAIVFIFKGGGTLCGNPSELWVQDYMKHIDQENKAYLKYIVTE